MRLKKSLWHRLDVRFLTLFGLLALLPLVVVAGINILSTSAIFEQDVKDRQYQLTRLLTQQIIQFLDHSRHELTSIGHTVLLNSGSGEIILADFALNNTFYNELQLLDADGQELYHIYEGEIQAAGRNLAADEIFFRPIRGEDYYSAVRFEGTQNHITVAFPIQAKGQTIGVVVALLDLETPIALLRNQEIGSIGTALLLDKRGTLIYGTNEINRRVSLVGLPPIQQIIAGQAKSETLIYNNYSEQLVVGSAVLIKNTNWILLIERPYANAFATFTNTLNNLLIGAAVIIALIIPLVSVLSWRLTRPIMLLSRAVQEVTKGNLAVHIPRLGTDEIGDLALAFDQMVTSLKQRLDEIQEKNEALNQASIEVAEAARLKDEFLAVMSHELRTPLNAIIGFTSFMLMDGESMKPEKRTYMLERVEANSQRLLALINDILDVAKIEAGRVPLAPSALDIRRAVQKLVAQLEILAHEKHLRLLVEFEASLPDQLMIDEDILLKILTNLISNAIKFTTTGSIQVRVAMETGLLWIEVQDTGEGIPPHLQTIIFDRFRQVDSSATRQQGGTGLGLAIVRGLCDAMQGTVQVQSEVGKGSIFTVKLPVELPASMRSEANVYP